TKSCRVSSPATASPDTRLRELRGCGATPPRGSICATASAAGSDKRRLGTIKPPMRAAPTILLLFLFSFAPAAPAANAQGRPDQVVTSQLRRIVVTPGAVQRNTYINKSIGVSYEFPEGWQAETPPLPATFTAEPAPILRAQPPNHDATSAAIALLVTPLGALPADHRDPAKFLPWWVQSAKSNANAGSTDVAPKDFAAASHAVEINSRPF